MKNISLVLIALTFMIGISSTSCGGGKGTKVAVDTVQVRTIIETVSASGKVQPEEEVKVGSDISGEIVELYVKEGDSVTKGQLLLVINADVYTSEYDRMQASLNQVKANLASAKSRKEQVYAQYLQAEENYNRSKKLKDKNAISDIEWTTAQTNFNVAKANLKSAEEDINASTYNVQSMNASLKAASTNLGRTKIYAPVSGIISKLSMKKGEKVVGTATMQGTEILRISNLSLMQVIVDVNENDIVKISLGDTTTVEVDAYINKKFKGVVTSIANSPKTSSSAITTDEVTNFEVKIRILPQSYEDLLSKTNGSPFRPGMSATVDIETDIAKNVVTVPIQSVTARKDTTITNDDVYNEFVFVVNENKVKMLKVKTGSQDNKYIQVIEGIKKGDVVVEAPYEAIAKKLKDGDDINIVNKKSLYKVEN